MQRLLIGLGIGGAVTFGLFVLMAYLIKADIKPPEEEEVVAIQIDMIQPDDKIRVRDRRIPKKPEPPKSPPPPQRQRAKAPKPKAPKVNFSIANIDASVQGDTYLGQVGGNMGDGDAIPMVIIQPNYPRKAAMEGIEGWVRFEFTVAPDGSPKDVRIIDAKPRRVFERDARRAIYKWKFKPKVVDGKAVEQPNMRYTMEFKLAD